MYILMITFIMFVFPIVSILVDLFVFRSSAGIMFLVGKYFVLWAVGIRLFTAGLRQAVNPRFTAEKILEIQGTEQFIIVQELGFANLAMGALGLSTMLFPNWLAPAALVGCLFFGLAGVRHIFSKERNLNETGALISNLVMTCVLLISLVSTLKL